MSINNYITELLSRLLSDLYIEVHLKGTKKFGSKVIIRLFLIERLFFILSTLPPNFLVSKTTFSMDPNRKITNKFTRKFDSEIRSK